MSGQDTHLFSNKSSGLSSVSRPSKLPLFSKRPSEKHLPPTSQPPSCSTFTTSSLGRVRPSTVVRPFFAVHHQSTVNCDAQRRRYPASQPSTPIRGGQPEMNQEFQQLHRSARSRHAIGNQSTKSSKSKFYRMENMSVEHLQYLERRLQQLLEILPFRSVLPAKAKSDSGRQLAHHSWVSDAHHLHHQALHYPIVATPLHYHPQTTPLLLLPPQSTSQPPPSASQLPPPHPAVSGPGFGDIDPYYLLSSSASCYAGSSPSSLQDFNRDELICLLHAVRNMLSMHQQNQTPSTSKSNSTLDPLSALQHRPFSWYFHRTADTTASSSPASSTANLFLDEDNSVDSGAADEGFVATDGSHEEEEGRRNNSGADGGPHPPLLPPGFRDFSRYLDSKFGPDSVAEQHTHHHHRHHQRRRHREVIDNKAAIPVVTTVSANGGDRGRSATDVRPKISITTSSGDTGPYSDLVLSPQESFYKTTTSAPTSGEANEITQRLVPTWCAPYWCPPPPPNSGQPLSWYHQVSPPPPLPPPPPPLPPTQVRYFAPPPNAAAACWFRAAANHFATAAAIFAADNAAAASVLASPHQLPPPFPHTTDPAFADRLRERRTPAAAPSAVLHPQNAQTASSNSWSSILHSPSQFSEDNSIGNSEGGEGRRCLRCLPAVEPLQRQLWGRRGDDLDPPHDSIQAVDNALCALDMLPQDPALILPDQVDFYTQIKDLLELDSNISLPLPAGWAVGVSSSGRRFYIPCTTGDAGSSDISERSASSRNITRTTTWQHPIIAPRIPLGWERVEMRRGNCVYYRHLLIPHTQRHHPDLWFPTSPKNVEFEQQSWFLDLRKLQESVSNFDKGNSQLIESYVNTRDFNEEAHFATLLKQHDAGQLEKLLKHLDCRFFRDLHRMVVAFEVARIRIVRELFVQHIHRTTASTTSFLPSAIDSSLEK